MATKSHKSRRTTVGRPQRGRLTWNNDYLQGLIKSQPTAVTVTLIA